MQNKITTSFCGSGDTNDVACNDCGDCDKPSAASAGSAHLVIRLNDISIDCAICDVEVPGHMRKFAVPYDNGVPVAMAQASGGYREVCPNCYAIWDKWDDETQGRELWKWSLVTKG